QVNFRIVDIDTNLSINHIDTDFLPTGYIGEWMHVAFRFKQNEEDETGGETLQVFVNGEPFLEEEPPFVRSQHSENLQIGFWAWQTFNGLIDEVKLFDEALTDERILEEMAAPEAPDPGLEAVLVYEAGQ